MRHMLERPQLADLVIPDLARWEDWSQVDRLVKLFKDADEQTSWVRVPVVNYLRQCPVPAAKEHIKKLEKIDPAAIKRANTFFHFVPAGGNRPEPVEHKSSGIQRGDEIFVSSETVFDQEDPQPVEPTSIETVQDTAIPAAIPSVPIAPVQPAMVASETKDGSAQNDEPNLWYALGVPFLVGLGLLFVQWRIVLGSND